LDTPSDSIETAEYGWKRKKSNDEASIVSAPEVARANPLPIAHLPVISLKVRNLNGQELAGGSVIVKPPEVVSMEQKLVLVFPESAVVVLMN
jgi:hypothetical protein